jgi:Kelch motif
MIVVCSGCNLPSDDKKCEFCKKSVCNSCFNYFNCCDTAAMGKPYTKIYGISDKLGSSEKLCCLDISNKDKPTLVDTGVVVPQYCRIVQLQNRIFVTGGGGYGYGTSISIFNVTVVADVSEFIEGTQEMKKVKAMTTARRGHTIARISAQSFCVVGGYNGNFITSCELYDISKNTWTPMPDLTEKKNWVGLLLFERKTLYCFGGCISK